jgi:hypothetical protein
MIGREKRVPTIRVKDLENMINRHKIIAHIFNQFIL